MRHILFHLLINLCKLSQPGGTQTPSKPGPNGPSEELIKLVVEIKTKNPRYGYGQIADLISNRFALRLDRHVVRRILMKHHKAPPPKPREGPSWLTFLGHTKDSLWSMDLFRCESVRLQSHWVMVVIDQYTRRIIGFAVHAGAPTEPDICRMFNTIRLKHPTPTYLSTDNDPLFEAQRWQANLRILDIEAIKSIPGIPISHPFIERLIGTIRREFLDHTLFWNKHDLEQKLNQCKGYYNQYRTHSSIGKYTPDQRASNLDIFPNSTTLKEYGFKEHCRGLFHAPEIV